MNIFYCPSAALHTYCELDEGETHHLIKVLRKKAGEEIPVFDGQGSLFAARVESTAKKAATVQIVRLLEQEEADKPRLHIAIALPKNTDRLEWFAEKVTEIGIAEISPMWCEHSERKNFNAERIHKVLVSACKQSKQYTLPQLNELKSFDELIKNSDAATAKFIAYCDEQSLHLKKLYHRGENALVLIGPEGDFSRQEVLRAQKNDFRLVSLGKSRLRLETAGIYAAAVFNLANE